MIPTHEEILLLIKKGDLMLDVKHRCVVFVLRHNGMRLDGQLWIRHDWRDGLDDRPGLMPVIECVRDECVGGQDGAWVPGTSGLSLIYRALRERLSPSKLFIRVGGRWQLTSLGSPPDGEVG